MDSFFRRIFFDDPRHEGFGQNFDDEDGHQVRPFENFDDGSMDLFRRMDNLMGRLFYSSFYSSEFERNNDQAGNESNPRSMMLNEPECGSFITAPSDLPFDSWQPSPSVDSDIDDNVAKNKQMLEDNLFKIMPDVSYVKFSSFKRLRQPDGTLEEKITVTDSQGNTTTKVHRLIGDQSYEITTRSDENGVKEKEEKFINIHEDDLFKFEEKWQNIKGEKPVKPAIQPPLGDPSFASIFKKFFG